MTNLWKENTIPRELKWEFLVVIPTQVYGSETWPFSAQEKRKIEVFKMMCLRNKCGKRRVDRVKNPIIIGRCECELSVLQRIERKVLRWFGYVIKNVVFEGIVGVWIK